MPLQPCNECGAEISSHAKTCPHCGIKNPLQSGVQRGLNETAKGLFGLGCGLPLMGFALLILWAIIASMAGC